MSSHTIGTNIDGTCTWRCECGYTDGKHHASSVDAGIASNWHTKDCTGFPPGDPRFHKLLREIARLHDMKQADYGTDGDPFANVRASEQWGVPAWVGTMIRANDKIKRLQAAANGSDLVNEGIEDSLMDLATYSLIALVLFREGTSEV